MGLERPMEENNEQQQRIKTCTTILQKMEKLSEVTAEDLKKPPACTRCGMCCIAAPCLFSEVGERPACIHLIVNKDNTTTCLNEAANREYVGVGCIFMRPQAKEIYELHMELYSVNERKRELAGG